MQLSDSLIKRKSTRAFLNKPVETEKIQQILNLARHAPSGVNTQPWQVAVVSGATKSRLQEKLEAAFRSGVKAKMDYQYYPQQWLEPFKSRRKACGLKMYSTLNIAREDKDKQLEQWAANYRAFDAPVMLLFFLDASAEQGSFLDYGMFLQSLMLAAVDQGLATCPQAALTEYPDIVKEELGHKEEDLLICGMALGYEDCDALVNSYRTEREDMSGFTCFFD
ncbi:nitroreductase [sulfur-oxidizing endosymbiont of Gigantopelta aegis]|uniref:nitroreductase n=1 Tax=sulfur-oxidizing endosymbiont of Gigantopelta aegis TaxID=2794934 RepID=UPI0018DC2376|nr:nitroreductase [sulfur-oxidizing endosymbiont of Gigantopelta aegis]